MKRTLTQKTLHGNNKYFKANKYGVSHGRSSEQANY
jgi:hypothetical protein